MVFLTNDWEHFKNYVENCRVGTYQTKATIEGVKISVLAGRLGFVKTFPPQEERKEEDTLLLSEILQFCKLRDFIEVIGSIPDEQFHS